MNIENNIQTIKQERKDLQYSLQDKNSSSRLQSNQIIILYIYGKLYDKKNQIHYYCKTLDGSQLIIPNHSISNYKQLVINYESFHSRLLFSELYQKHYKEIRTQALIQTQQPEEIYQQKVEQEIIEEEYKEIHSPSIHSPPRQRIEYPKKQIKLQPQMLLKKPKSKRRKINYVLEELSQKSESMDDVYITQINKKIKDKKNKIRIRINSPVQSQDGDKASIPQHSKMNILQQSQQVKAYGKFNYDIPSHISKHKMDIKSLEKLQINAEDYQNLKYQIQNYFYKIEWKHSKEGKKRHGNYYAYKEVRRLAPRMLVEYLQKMGKFIR